MIQWGLKEGGRRTRWNLLGMFSFLHLVAYHTDTIPLGTQPPSPSYRPFPERLPVRFEVTA